MDTRQAVLTALSGSVPLSYVKLMGASCQVAPDCNLMLLPGVLHQLVLEGRVVVDCGVYSAK